MRAIIQSTPAYELTADLTRTELGHNLKFISFVPTARRPEHQIKFQGIFSTEELIALRELITQELESCP